MSASLAPECNELKECAFPIHSSITSPTDRGNRKYDTCFLKWYSDKFLRGTAIEKQTECDALFTNYSKCLWRALEAKGVAGMVGEARKEAEETDREHMKAPGIPGRS
jgi:TRIAP1/MDM35 family protein